MTVHEGQLSFSIINTQMTVEAMRDSGYKSTTHFFPDKVISQAIAEVALRRARLLN